MFLKEKLEAAFKVALGKSGPQVAFSEAEVDGLPAALVTLTSGEKTAQRIFTEADQASSKLAQTIKAFCERVA